MGAYHNKLDKKYFNKSIYMKKFESAFDIRLKDYPLQYEIALDTFNAFFSFNNILFSSNYIPTSQKVDNIIHTLRSYINKYQNKHKKSFDKNCIMLYEKLEDMLDEMEEIKQLNITKGMKINLKPFEISVEQYMGILDAVHFDNLVDSKVMPYEKKANDKLPKKVNLKIIDNLDIKTSTIFNYEKQKELNNAFVSDYLKKTGIDLSKEKDQRYFIFDTLNRIKDLNNAIVDYKIYKDKAVLNLLNYYLSNDYLKQDISFVKDITFINLFNKLKIVSQEISNDNIDMALTLLKELLDQFKDLYERNSWYEKDKCIRPIVWWLDRTNRRRKTKHL